MVATLTIVAVAQVTTIGGPVGLSFLVGLVVGILANKAVSHISVADISRVLAETGQGSRSRVREPPGADTSGATSAMTALLSGLTNERPRLLQRPAQRWLDVHHDEPCGLEAAQIVCWIPARKVVINGGRTAAVLSISIIL